MAARLDPYDARRQRDHRRIDLLTIGDTLQFGSELFLLFPYQALGHRDRAKIAFSPEFLDPGMKSYKPPSCELLGARFLLIATNFVFCFKVGEPLAKRVGKRLLAPDCGFADFERAGQQVYRVLKDM